MMDKTAQVLIFYEDIHHFWIPAYVFQPLQKELEVASKCETRILRHEA